MLTQKPAAAPLAANGTRPLDANLVCYFQGEFVPLAEARLPVMTHGFLYGTATFEGIRAYWNDEQEQLVELTVDLLRRNNFRQDAYVRPTLYKSTEAIGVRLHNLEEDLLIFAVPFGEYIAIDRGITAQVVSWRRNSDQSLPARSKIVGAYVNSAFSKSEA